MNSDQQTASPVDSSRDHTITLPRWVVYFQGGLLGVVATTFFIFGMMVGSLTGPSAVKVQSCRVTGQVTAERGGSSIPDSGSVVVLLPVEVQNVQRIPPADLHPAAFKPLNNPAIEKIHEMGGAIVRANESGEFEFYVDAPKSFDLLVISTMKGRDDLSKAEMAGIGKFFLPVEDLLGDNKFVWKRVSTSGTQTNLGRINFQ